MKNRHYWAGYCDGRIYKERMHDKYSAECFFQLAIFTRRKAAKKRYQDVRQVEIREIKGSKKPKCQNS